MKNSKLDIIIIADSEDYIEQVKQLLHKSEFKVHGVLGFNNAYHLAQKQLPNGIILDVKLKEIDGIDACGRIRSDINLRECFIVFLTEEDEEYVQIAALNAGADDYIILPVKPKIFQQRIKVLNKRRRVTDKNGNDLIISNGNVTIDREQYKVSQGTKSVVLPRKEFELLYLLATKPGKVFSRIELSKKIWDEDEEVKGRTIDVHIRKIREKLGDHLIITIKGIGYKWNDSVLNN